VIFLEEEFRAFCPTGEGGGVKNDCSANEGGPKVDNSWKREQEKVLISGKDLKKSPPAKSLAGVKSVTISDGELVSKSLREVGVTLDQAAKACAALDPESDVVIAHGGMREIIEYMGSEDPDRYIEDTVTFVSTMPVAGIEGAAKTAASLTRFEGGELVMSYTMLMISDEAKAKASVAVARHMMKGTIASITQAEKIGVTSVEMLAAGDNRDSSDFKGYRIWPRLGFNGVIPRQRITPTWSLARGFFNSYGSGIPDKILSPRARKEKAAGALTIQSLYETKEGQEWWEKNGGEMEMSLNVGDAKDPGWKRFTSLRDRFSKRGLDLADAFFDVEARALLDDDWVEYRNGGCEKVEGGRFAPGNDCASDGSGGSSSKTDDSWKESNDSVSLSGNDLKEKPPFAGAEKAGRVEIANPKALLEGMAQAGVKSLDDLAAMGGATVRGSEVVFSGAGHPEMGAYLSVENRIPVSRSGDGSEGYFQVGVSVYKEGREHVLGLNEMFPTQEVKASRERVAKATSLMQQAVIESIMAADNSGIARVKMSAAGGPEYDLKGYRLWPQFGFDAPLEPSHKHALAKAPPDVIEKVMRVARPDLFATRIKPSAGALAAALPQSNINVQHLVSFHEGDLWWDNNGSTLGMVLDLSDKKSLGYAKFQKRVSQLKKLRERNQERSFFQWLDEEAEFRAGADCGRVEGGRFGSGNDCASEDGADSLPADDDGGLEMDSEAVSASPPFKGAEVLDSFSVNDVHSLKGLLGDLGKVKTVENVVAISGGARQGGSISIDSYGESIIANSSIPVSPDGSDQLGSIKNMVSLMKDDDGNLVVAYDSMSLDSKAMSSIDGESEGDSADRRRIVSLVLERMTESMSVAEKSGAVRADTIAAGNSGSALQGYRLWPQFGFDGLLDRADVDAIKADVKLTPEQRRRANSGSMTVQQLIATPEGDRWWNENGTTIELSFDFTNKESVGYKRFERMKKMLERLKERNKNRSEFVDGVEQRDAGCEKTEGGRFAKGNDCAKGDGSGSEQEPKAGKKKDSDDIPLGNVRRQETLLRGGKSVVVIDAEAKARAKADLERNPKPAGSHPGSSADLYGREIVSRDDPRRPNKITRLDPVFAESDLAQNGTYVSHDAVGRLLSSRHEDARKELGGEGPAAVFDTRDDLPQEQFEYVVAALKEDVDRAYEEGRNPGFYSTDIAECMDIMSGFYPELKDPDEAKRRGTTPEDAAFVFTMITAITSNGTDPALNLESADRIYRLYREHGSVRTPDQVMGGERATEIRKSLNRFQAMIDEFGESRTRSLLSGVTRASTIASTMKRLAAKSQEIGGSWSEKDLKGVELGDEVVPVAAIFGPKIGSFFANLSGKHQFLTMDRWLMRSVGRVTGELLSRATPNAANKQANAAIRAIKQRARSRDILFGVDKPPLSLKREDVIRSLELQARTGIIEESSAAFEWAKAAERSFNKVPRGVSKSGEPSGSYGTHPDPQIDAAHRAGNTIFKSLIHEQQDPRSARARHVLRGVFREVAKRVAAENPSRLGEVQVSEIQAVLWQYEQNLWKRLGAKTKIEGDSLYSAAAKSLKQRRDSGEEPVALKPEKARRPKSVRSYDATRQDGAATDGETDFPNQSGQDLWDNETELAGVDFVELLKAISSEKESRAFCPTGEGGGVDNSCGSDDGSSSSSRSPESMPRSFPRGSEKFRDAIDSVSPNPKAVWDRSRGRADTPPEKVITAAADEQGSSGASLTPEAEASYKDLIDEIGRQYEALTAAGLKAKAWRGEGEPYGDPPGSTKPNSDKMREEVAKTGEFSFFMTEKGFGTGSATPDHPMLRETKYKTADGEPMIANDLFRVVHDMVAHVRGGYSFSTNGEYNGMLTHASTLPESAWPALFAETFGQNAVYEKTGNYAPQNAYASKVGPEIIKAELAKRNRKVRRAIDAEYESDEPLGYQHLKVRPWLMKGVTESRSADCGRDEGGRFGSGNDCAADEGGSAATATAAPSGDRWSSNETLSWPETSRDTSPPPVGDGRYGSINVSAPKAVKASLDAAGIDPKLAPMVAGGSEESDVFVRPAPDFSMEFPDSKVTPVMFAFERDFAGVESGLHGSSVIGVTASGETVVYHSTVNVADSIKSDDSKRHAAAREFYRAMTSSVEAARKAGVSRIVLNAAGNSSATKGSVTSTPWRGYTIWPRMGFDAPLPASIKAKLPPDLSHAKSLLDLHATPEGTRWWRDNGEDLDVTFDLKDRSSPQAKIMDRFIKKFGESRREMPLGSGDEWMSPEDLVRLDEMWQEIWDDGELDDYEWVESRSADCGRDEGGRFDQGNQCQRGAGKVAALAKSGASHEELTAAIAEAIGTKRGWFTGPEAGESSPSEVCEALGLNVANDWIVDKYHAESTQYTREAIAKTIAEVYAAVQAVPSLKDVEFHIQTAQSIAKHTGTSQFRWEGVQGAYLPVDNEIHILAGTTDSQITPEFLHKSGYSSTPSPAHTLVHEDVHREHYENAAAKTGSPRPPKHATEEQVYRWATGLKMDIMRNLEVAATRDPAWIYRCESKVEKLGFYATTDPLEFVAEYATAVKLGYAKNDPDLDKMCKAMLAPVPRKAKA